jgi:hypothetical protein
VVNVTDMGPTQSKRVNHYIPEARIANSSISIQQITREFL